ncbi:ATP-binding response regulator [Polaribacter sp. P097]|uniref:ATP-binding response regulator n=1 Tax=Polaribacter sp. P097 TaxID=3117398 RepID=UPI002FE1F541
MNNILGAKISTRRFDLLKAYLYIGTAIASSFWLVSFYIDSYYLRFLFTICVALCFASLYFLYRKPRIARLIFVIDYFITVIVCTPLIGKEGMFDIFYGFYFLLITLLYSFRKEKVHIITFFSLTTVAWIFLISWNYFGINIAEIDTENASTYFYPITFLGNFIFLSSTLISFAQKNERYTRIVNEKKNEALKILKLKNIFLNAINEEIREPLNSIIGLTHVLKDNNPRKDQEEYLKSLNSSGISLLELFTNVININTLESKKVSIKNRETNLNTLIENVIQIHKTACSQKNVNLIAKIDVNFPIILIDHVRYQQILNNLVSNAVKFTNEGEIILEIKILRKNKNKIVFSTNVIDTGIGISKDKIDVIWQNFTQASNSTARLYGGSGLGLPIVKNIVRSMGSDIQLKSEPNKGSHFYFELTANIAKTSKLRIRNIAKVKKEEITVIQELANKKILVTDDNKINILVLKKILEKENAIIDEACNGLEAVEATKSKKYDLIIMDLNMPVMSGEKAIANIRKLDKDIPIIIITASNSYDLEDFKNQNISYTIRKPFVPKELLQNIKKALSN